MVDNRNKWMHHSFMDPFETLIMILEDLEIGDFASAKQDAAILAEWLNRGGFAPEIELHSPRLLKFARFDEQMAKVVCHSACNFVLNLEISPKPKNGLR